MAKRYKLPPEQRDAQRYLDELSGVVGALETSTSWLRGTTTLLSVTVPAGGQLRADHALGRTPSGWLVVDRTSAGSAYRTAWDTESVTFSNGGGSDASFSFVLF